MESITELILVPKTRLKTWINIDWNNAVFNLTLPDSVLLENKDKIKGPFLYKDIKLIRKCPEYAYWRLICFNDEDEFVDLILENLDKLGSRGYDNLQQNCNPRLADTIIKNITYPDLFAMNSNSGLTEYMITHWKDLPNEADIFK